MTPTEKRSDSSGTSMTLLSLARQSDPAAWKRLTQLYGPTVYRWARQAGLQDSDAADVMKDVFSNVARSLGTFNRDEPTHRFQKWLWTITRNEVIKVCQRMGRSPTVIGGSEGQAVFEQYAELPEPPSDGTGATDQTRLAHRALELLKSEFEDRTWQAFWGTAIEDRPAAEVGEPLGMNAKAVRQARYRVLCRLREELADES